MPATTSDLVKEFVDAGYTAEEAADFALDYIYEGFKESVEEYINYRKIYEDGVLNTAFIDEEAEPVLEFDIDMIDEAPARLLDIGCDYESGEKVFVEDDRDNIFIPSSYYCALKCLNKSFDRNKRIIDAARTSKKNEWTGLSTFKVSPYYMKKQKAELIYKKSLLKYMHDVECDCRSTCDICKRYDIARFVPTFYRVNPRAKTIDSIAKLKPISIVNDCILLVYIGNGKYHATLAKQPRPLSYNSYDWKLKVTDLNELTIEETRIRPERSRDPEDYIFVYDIETYEVKEDAKVKLIPYALAYAFVDLKNKVYTKPVIIEMNSSVCDDNIFNTMFDHFDVVCKEKNIQSIQVFAHNGAKFDNIYAKSVTNMLIVDSIIDGTTNKSITFKRRGENGSKYALDAVKYTFKDTLPFVLSSLASALKTYKCATQKMDFDIAHYTLEQYRTETLWKKYLHCDVAGLAELTIAVEENVRSYGLSITTCLGASSMAWKLMRKTCIESDSLYVPKSPSLRKFMNASCIGGRVLHWKKSFDNDENIVDDPMISLDYNSLYPSAMYAFAYPIGQCYAIEDVNNFDPFNQNMKHYIIEVEMDAGNVRYPIHPYRDHAGNLMYQAGVFTGVYNDVDIKEMLRDGYKIRSVKKGIYWLMSAKIMSNLISDLYEKRKQYKLAGDVREYTIKIILNSMYGKFLEQIQTHSVYSDTPKEGKHVISKNLLRNGQTEYIIKNDQPIVTKPTYIAGYILANARRLMNEYIDRIGRQNIWYQDTDSIYTKLSCIKGIDLGNDLCQLKNDYGEGKYIVKAYFVDLKRYLLIFNDDSVRVKFLGLNFNNDTWMGDFTELDSLTPTRKQCLVRLFEDLKNGNTVQIKQDKWLRAGLQVSIDTKNIGYVLNPNKRARWAGNDDDEYYPYGYDHRVRERTISCNPVRSAEANSDAHIHEKFYRIVNRLVHSKSPLVYNNKLYLAELTGIPTDHYIRDGRVYRLMHGMLYETGAYGAIAKQPLPGGDLTGYTNITFIPATDFRAYLPSLTRVEVNKLHNKLTSMERL